MSAHAVARASIWVDTIEKATAALEAMGFPFPTQSCLLMMRRRRASPAIWSVPRPSTEKAMEVLEEGQGKRLEDAGALFDDLGR